MKNFWEVSTTEPTELEALSMQKTGLLSQRVRPGVSPERRAELTRQIEDIDRRRVELGVKPRDL
jgi:hypothetical protein